jgi:hypothetical protein
VYTAQGALGTEFEANLKKCREIVSREVESINPLLHMTKSCNECKLQVDHYTAKVKALQQQIEEHYAKGVELVFLLQSLKRIGQFAGKHPSADEMDRLARSERKLDQARIEYETHHIGFQDKAKAVCSLRMPLPAQIIKCTVACRFWSVAKRP